MCGRFSQAMTLAQILERFHVDSSESFDWQVKYNVAPSLLVPTVVALSGQKPKAMLMKWGLIPPWAKSVDRPLINLRSDTVQNKTGFKRLLVTQRCIVPVDGYYEWKAEGKTKKPYRFVMKSGEIFSLGGLYNLIKLENGDLLYTCCLITTDANDLGGTVHDRMPVIVPREKEAAWLSSDSRLAEYVTCLAPFSSDDMKAYPVSPKMNSGKLDDPTFLLPL